MKKDRTGIKEEYLAPNFEMARVTIEQNILAGSTNTGNTGSLKDFSGQYW